MKFLWTTIAVSDMNKSLEFYRNAVGLELERRYSPAPPMEIAFLGRGDTKVELVCNKNGGPVIHREKGISLGFATASLDLKIRELESMGIGIYEGPFHPVPTISFFYVLDPDGVKIQFVEEKVNPEG